MLEQFLREIASTPNAPFLYQPSKNMLGRIFSSNPIPDLSIQEDEFATYARVKRGNPNQRVMVVTHIDHPAVVLKDSFSGIALGSVGYDRITQHLALSPIPVQVYDPAGNYQQLAYIKDFRTHRGTPVISLQAKKPVQANSHAIWDILNYEKTNGIIRMLNADNGAVTATAIELLRESATFNDIDLEVVFAYVEEVHQISSTGIALQGRTPFGTIDASTIVINLEAMEVETTSLEQEIIAKLGLPYPDYSAGVLIKVNDGQLVYGLHFPNSTNESELLVKQAADRLGICYQYTVTTGSTDAKSFSLFPLTPHIVTLAVPCKWKHNQGPKGEFVPEEVYERDLESTLALLKAVTRQCFTSSRPSDYSLNAKLKEIGYGLSLTQVAKLRRLRVKIMRAAQPRLRKGVYFDTNIKECIEFNFWRVASKIVT